jgi:Tfp pilus assembly protein PilV
MDRSSIAGFSILEIFLAILIISISAIVITFFTKNTIGNYSNARLTEAAYISGEQKISELNATPIPTNGTDIYTLETDTFTRSWTVSSSGYPRTAVVNVDWALMGKPQAIKVYGVLP